MSYGLFDADVPTYPYIPFFNLELMKLSAYYKRQKEIVILSPSFLPNHYQHFIFRQDFPGENYPIIKYKNIEYGGRAFNFSKYHPLPMEIEKMKPDTFLYNKIEPQYQTSKNKTAAFRRMKKAEHLRLSLDGKTVWSDFESQLKRTSKNVGIIFHDYDLGAIENGYETVIDLLKEFNFYQDGKRIGMKFPVQTNTAEELLKWAAIKPMQHFYSIQYNGVLTFSLIKEFKEVTKHTSSVIQSYHNVTKASTYEKFITQDIVELYRQVCFLRTNQVYFSLIYDTDFFQDKRWGRIIQLFNVFLRATKDMKPKTFQRISGYDSMYNFVTKISTYRYPEEDQFSADELRELFQFVRQNNYELFQMFYEYKV